MCADEQAQLDEHTQHCCWFVERHPYEHRTSRAVSVLLCGRACRCGACLWRSCVSGVQCMAQLAVEVGRCGSRGAVRGTQGSGRRDRRARKGAHGVMFFLHAKVCKREFPTTTDPPRARGNVRELEIRLGRELEARLSRMESICNAGLKNYRLTFPRTHPRTRTCCTQRPQCHTSLANLNPHRPGSLSRTTTLLAHLAEALRPAQARLLRTSVGGSSAVAEARFGVAGPSTWCGAVNGVRVRAWAGVWVLLLDWVASVDG